MAIALTSLAGCASLPPPPPRTPSTAFTDTRDTTLGRLATASLVGAGSGESGFRLLPTGDFALDARIALTRRAERSLDVQYYQLQEDSVGLLLLRELRDAARPNVQVRLFNPLPARGDSLVGRFLFSLHDFSRINHRMHNKLYVADNRFSISGGRNLADEYFMRSEKANFIDMDVLAAGPVVRELSDVFDHYWNGDYAWPVESVVTLPLEAAAVERRFDELVQNAAPEFAPSTSDPLGRTSVELELEAGRVPLTLARAEVFADSPDKVARRGHDENVATVARSTLAAINAARTEVQIASPYFIPGPIGMALMTEARQHNVRVVVITNALGASDEPLVHWRYARYRRDLLKIGVEIYELSPNLTREAGRFGDFGKSFGRLLAKVAVIDRQQLFVGSLNLDQRSAWSNTESGLLIDSPALAQDILDLVANDRNQSVYRLRLGADGETIEWVATLPDGSQRVLTVEPDNSWLLRLKMLLLGPLTSEDLL